MNILHFKIFSPTNKKNHQTTDFERNNEVVRFHLGFNNYGIP